VGNIGGLDDYYYLNKRSTMIIANPALKPEKRINYQVGFKQSVGKKTDLTLQAFYGEIRDMVQLTAINNAYPVTYSTLGNIDFGTIKGFMAGYDFYRHKDSSGLQFGVNYTLQFAKGTGSTETAAQGLLNSGQPNLRNPIALDYDSRHLFSGTIDYRFGQGGTYIGPRGMKEGGKTGLEKIFENTGISLVLNARSGTPYTRQVNATSGSGILIGVSQRSSIAGEINGSRLPWQFRSDLRIDKDFILHKGMGKDRRPVGGMTVYLQVNNLLNSKNIVSVYRYTGLPDDDGYLQTAEGKAQVSEQPDQQAFTDQYNVKMVNPDNYIQPRFLRLGAMISF
jgi:outer membrane receptor protein involved in Fe transport